MQGNFDLYLMALELEGKPVYISLVRHYGHLSVVGEATATVIGGVTETSSQGQLFVFGRIAQLLEPHRPLVHVSLIEPGTISEEPPVFKLRPLYSPLAKTIDGRIFIVNESSNTAMKYMTLLATRVIVGSAMFVVNELNEIRPYLHEMRFGDKLLSRDEVSAILNALGTYSERDLIARFTITA